LPEQHPIIYWRLKMALEKRHFPVIVVDPRVTMFAQMADIHLPVTPGTDLVLLNALAHVILKENLHDQAYTEAHTTGFEVFAQLVGQYDPVTAAGICGIDEDTIRHVARLYAKAGAAMSIWTMGINQSTHGSDGVVAINNLNLITGNIGKPGATSLSITGQCNAMGTREWSSCSGLPGYRTLEKETDRNEVAAYWGMDPEFFPKARGLYMTDIFPAIETGQIKALWLIATNPMTSMPNMPRIRKSLQNLEFLVVQDAYADVETTKYAHVYLPAALWGEKEGVFTNTERRVNLVRQVDAARGFPNRPVDFQPDRQALRAGPQNPLPGVVRRSVRRDARTLPRAHARLFGTELRQDRIAAWCPVALHRRCADRLPASVYRRRVPASRRKSEADRAAVRRQQRAPGPAVPVLAEQRPRGRAFSHPHAHRQDRQRQQVQPDALHGNESGRGVRPRH
jgi:anaerobic selenocysteine-containing dehydrogenase